ncbi:two-component system response regulator [Gammaproteobacteria bacterium 53_120_T64]|nr:two-component system response regulator [Gammaproteobacteria bacterium 53_120_T64]
MTEQNFKAASILLVDDDDVDAMGIERALKKMKLANPFYRARDGIEGLEMLRNKSIEQPYMLLLDLNMPRMTGIEMLKELRSDPTLRGTVVFVLTTSDEDQDKLAAYNEHIAGYIVKTKLDTGFDELLKLLDCYWRLVELPINE